MEKMQRKLDRYEFLLDFMAHEIRNPLNSIIMFGNLMAEGSYGALAPPQAEILQRMLASAYRIEHMTGDFLNLRRVDSSGEMLHREWLDLRKDIIEVTLGDLSSKFPEHEARLARVQPQGCCSGKLFADRQLLLTLYDNLFFNALKYGRPGGRVSWGCRVRGEFWEMNVYNEGQGVRKTELPRIFRKFHRVRDEKVPRQPGTGLGLYNVQRIVRLHGGRAWAESRYGRDFAVWFSVRRPGSP